MSCFIDLSIKIIREHYGIFPFSSTCCPFSYMYKIRTYRGMRAMLFENADGKNTGMVRSFKSFWPIGSSEFIPACRQFLCSRRKGDKKEKEEAHRVDFR